MSTKDDDYEHWPDDDKLQAATATPAPRYDNHNGLYEHTYHATGEVKEPAATPKATKARTHDDTPSPPNYVHYSSYGPYGLHPQMSYNRHMPYMPYPYGYGGGRKSRSPSSSRSLRLLESSHEDPVI